jgi:Subtilase family
VVGVSDTGLDHSSCFFADPAMPVPMCVTSDWSEPPGCINAAHRKIVSYRSFPWSDNVDTMDGHGTHICGIVAGESEGSDFNGVAPGICSFLKSYSPCPPPLAPL